MCAMVHAGQDVKPGDSIEASEHSAQKLIARGCAVKAGKKKAGKKKAETSADD